MSRIKYSILAFTCFSVLVLGVLAGSWYVVAQDTAEYTDSTGQVDLVIPIEASEFQPGTDTQELSAVAAPQTEIVSQISPDGKIVLSVEQAGTEYEVFIGAGTEAEDAMTLPKLIFTGQVSSEQTITIPFNTWSPDNKYFFLERSQNESSEYLVFKTSGDSFSTAEGETPFINVTAEYLEREFPYQLQDVTGWAAMSSLLVQTDGPDYWYVIGTQSFVQLSTKF